VDPQAVFLDFDSLHPADLDRSVLQQTVPDWQWFDETAPEQVQQRMAGARIVVSNKVVLDRELLENSPDLKLIALILHEGDWLKKGHWPMYCWIYSCRICL